MRKSLTPLIVICIISWISIGVFFFYEEYTEFNYEVEVEKCSGEIDTLNFTTAGGIEVIQTSKEAVSVLIIGKEKFINVCNYKILNKKKLIKFFVSL